MDVRNRSCRCTTSSSRYGAGIPAVRLAQLHLGNLTPMLQLATLPGELVAEEAYVANVRLLVQGLPHVAALLCKGLVRPGLL